MRDIIENPRPRYVRKSGLCEYMDCGPTFVYQLTLQGKLTPIRLSPRLTVYDLDEADALIELVRKEAAA